MGAQCSFKDEECKSIVGAEEIKRGRRASVNRDNGESRRSKVGWKTVAPLRLETGDVVIALSAELAGVPVWWSSFTRSAIRTRVLVLRYFPNHPSRIIHPPPSIRETTHGHRKTPLPAAGTMTVFVACTDPSPPN